MKKFTLLTCLMLGYLTAQADIEVSSPSDKLQLTIGVQDNKPYYKVVQDTHDVISPSLLGVKYGSEEYYEFDSAISDKLVEVNDAYTLGHGKRSHYENHYKEQTVTFKNSANNRELTMVFRIYDNAVAFRYTQSGTGTFVWDNEQTEFNFNSFKKCWVQRSYDAGYSDYYEGRSWDDIQKTTYKDFQYGYCVPMLVQTANKESWCLLTESAALSSIAASTIVKGNKSGSVKLEIVKHGNKLGTQQTESRFTAPFESPWRTIIIGTLPEIVESNVTQNLSPANIIGDDAWVKPGRVAWNWAAEDSSNQLDSKMCRHYTDMAAHFGWEYNLLDEGWEGRLNVQDEVNYAKQKGVGLILWFNQNHFKSDYASIYNEMKKYADMGVKGFKIDFFEDDRQAQLKKYEDMLDAAQKLKLVINFHGCTKPSGLDRTWPNLLTMEANYGGEMYMFWPHMTPAYHMVNLALTRNVLGSMDYTPLKWGMSTNSIRSIDNSTWGQQLALTVAYETGLFHPSDTPENLQYSVADALLKKLPVTWDGIKCLDAQPDQYVTIARRKGNDWWVATIANNARTASISTDYLEEGKTYYAHIYRDGDYRYEVKSEVRQGIKKGDTMKFPVMKYGGAIVIFTTDDAFAYPHDRTFEAENYNQGGTVATDTRMFGGKYVTNLGPENHLVFDDVVAPEDGLYAVTIYYHAKSATYVYVENSDGVKSRLSLVQPGVRDGSHPGENIGFRTALVQLKKGFNTLTIGNDQGGQTPMIDHITVRPVDSPAPYASDYLTADGTAKVNGTLIEAESGEGDGVVTTDTNCSGGQRLSSLAAGKKRTYTVNVEKDGIYDFTIFYMGNGTRDLEVAANGWTVKLTCPTTGTDTGLSIKNVTTSLYLKAGENTFTLGGSTAQAPNLDKIQVAFLTDAGPHAEKPVEAMPQLNSDGYVDWAAFLGLDANVFKRPTLIQYNEGVYVVAADQDGMGSQTRTVAIVNTSKAKQRVYVSGRRLGFFTKFTNEDNKNIWGLTENPEAGETIIHTFTGTRIEPSRYEAENARIANAGEEFLQRSMGMHASCDLTVELPAYQSADGDKQAAVETSLEWDNVYSKNGGDYNLTFVFAAPSNRYVALYVNGEYINRWSTLNTGAMNKADSRTMKVTLKPGNNTIRLATDANDTKLLAMPRIDYFDLAPLFNTSGDVTQSIFYQYGKNILDKAIPLFYNKGTGNDAYQWSNHYQKGSNDRGAIENIWWQGYAMATFAEFAKASRGTTQYDTYAKMCTNMANLFPAFVKDIDGRVCWMMRPGYGHRFSDDDAWASIGLLEAYDLEHRQFYIDQLRMFGEWAWQLWDEKGGGGMYWQDAPASEANTLNVKNAANNNPTCIIFTRLYEITGEQIWLERAIKTYQWVRSVLMDSQDFQIRDNIAVKDNNKMNTYKGAYNQGSFINAGILLYRATGTNTYYADANTCAKNLNGRKFINYKSPVLGKTVTIAKADGDMLGRDLIVIARGYEEMNQVATTTTNIDLIKNTMLNAYGERIDAESGLMKDGWYGNSGQTFDGKENWFDGLVQLGFLETFARLAMNDNFEDYTTSISETPVTTNGTATATVYNLGGLRVGNSLEGLPAGIYIVVDANKNKKKVIIP